MNAKRILVIQGHPDTKPGHLCHALAAAYCAGANEAGHVVRCIMMKPEMEEIAGGRATIREQRDALLQFVVSFGFILLVNAPPISPSPTRRGWDT